MLAARKFISRIPVVAALLYSIAAWVLPLAVFSSPRTALWAGLVILLAIIALVILGTLIQRKLR